MLLARIAKSSIAAAEEIDDVLNICHMYVCRAPHAHRVADGIDEIMPLLITRCHVRSDSKYFDIAAVPCHFAAKATRPLSIDAFARPLFITFDAGSRAGATSRQARLR